MFRKIRRNFIIIAMSSVSFILLVVNVVINVVNYNQQVGASDQIIASIEREKKPEPSKNASDPKVGDNRYFISYLKDDLTIDKIDYTHIDTTILTEETATTYTKEVLESKAERGYKDIYRFHVSKQSGENKIVFLDCRRSIENYRTYFTITVFSSLGALVAYFLIIFFGSNFVLKPVKESYEKQNRFITNASHELKTPLTIISANNELIEMKKGNSEYSKNIDKQVNRMNNMIKDLISLSKLNEGRKITFETVDVSELLLDELKDFKNICVENKLKLVNKVDKNIKIIANKECIKQIISIVLDNARKYSKSHIDISLTNKKGNVILKETNNGTNIEDGDLYKYTERFYRHEHSRTHKEGSGIGLSLLTELANKINAKIKIYGEHSKFNIEMIFSNKNKVK